MFRIRLLLNESLVEEMDKYEESGELMDKIQGKLECCGVHNFTDWQSDWPIFRKEG